jgi:hypothetical protein
MITPPLSNKHVGIAALGGTVGRSLTFRCHPERGPRDAGRAQSRDLQFEIDISESHPISGSLNSHPEAADSVTPPASSEGLCMRPYNHFHALDL